MFHQCFLVAPYDCTTLVILNFLPQRNVPGGKGSANIIGGSDLLVHNRGRNSDLDEWLKDAAEVRRPARPLLSAWGQCLACRSQTQSLSSLQEERQHRREESIGENLFR